MNDNLSPDADDLPDWAWDIINRDDLLLRAECSLEAVIVLLTDAATSLKEAAQGTFREQALTPETLNIVTECAAMVADAVKLAPPLPEGALGGHRDRS